MTECWQIIHALNGGSVSIKLISVFLAFAGIANGQILNVDAINPEKISKKLSGTFLKIESPGMLTTKTADTEKYPWKLKIVTTTFWIGERATKNNPVPNRTSAWDQEWARNYGGSDNPESRNRRNYIPVTFVPRQNPFYIALPYNDVIQGKTKPEAVAVIPWFKQAFKMSGQTVCKDRWIAIRKGDRVAYAQWEDCGPFRTDQWEYVFGNDRPRANLNRGAGLDVSPAVRDYLGMNDTDATDWRFVDFEEVPPGPWTQYGDNNTFVLQKRKAASGTAMARNTSNPIVPIGQTAKDLTGMD